MHAVSTSHCAARQPAQVRHGRSGMPASSAAAGAAMLNPFTVANAHTRDIAAVVARQGRLEEQAAQRAKLRKPSDRAAAGVDGRSGSLCMPLLLL